jgi:hypothetical protein
MSARRTAPPLQIKCVARHPFLRVDRACCVCVCVCVCQLFLLLQSFSCHTLASPPLSMATTHTCTHASNTRPRSLTHREHAHTHTSLHAHVPAGSRRCSVTLLGECMQCNAHALSITLLPPHCSMQCTPRVHDFFRDWKNAERAHLCIARLSRLSL